MRKELSLICVLTAFCSSAFAVREADADLITTLSFFNITNDNAEDVAAQLTADVDLSGTTLTFTFKNTGTTSSVITQAYWDNGSGVSR